MNGDENNPYQDDDAMQQNLLPEGDNWRGSGYKKGYTEVESLGSSEHNSRSSMVETVPDNQMGLEENVR